MFIEVNLLLSQVVEFKNLVVDNQLSFFKGIVDLFDLVLNLFDLLVGVGNHLVAVLDLVLELPGELLFLSLLVVLLEELLSLVEKISLLLTNLLHLVKVVFDLLEIRLSLGACSIHISDKELKLARPLVVLMLKIELDIVSLLLHVVKLSG